MAPFVTVLAADYNSKSVWCTSWKDVNLDYFFTKSMSKFETLCMLLIFILQSVVLNCDIFLLVFLSKKTVKLTTNIPSAQSVLVVC